MLFALALQAGTVEDVLNQSVTGVTGTTYTDFTATGTSGTSYVGQCAGSNSSIQLRSNNSNSGVVSTVSVGNARKVTVEWNTNTTTSRVLQIYGSSSAYSAATDLYDAGTYGELLGEITYDGSTTTGELEIESDYAFIGFRSKSGAMYLTSVTIEWETEGDVVAVTAPTITPSSGTYYEAQTVTITADDDATIIYTINDGDEQTYTEAFVLSEAGSYTIAAYAVVDGNTSSTTTRTIVISEITTYTTCAELRENTADSSSSAETV